MIKNLYIYWNNFVHFCCWLKVLKDQSKFCFVETERRELDLM